MPELHCLCIHYGVIISAVFDVIAGTLPLLETDMRIVHKLMLGSDNLVNSQLCSLLEQLGVKRLTPRDVISHHILPILSSEETLKVLLVVQT